MRNDLRSISDLHESKYYFKRRRIFFFLVGRLAGHSLCAFKPSDTTHATQPRDLIERLEAQNDFLITVPKTANTSVYVHRQRRMRKVLNEREPLPPI